MPDSRGDQPFIIHGWTIDPLRCEIRRGSEIRRVEPKAMAVLAALARRPGETIAKSDLIEEVWEGRFVSDEVLTVAIHHLRKALGDDAQNPRFIETIPRRGYRWLPCAPKASSGPNWRLRLGAGGAFLALAAAIGVAVWSDASPDSDAIDSLAVLPLTPISGDPQERVLVDGLTDALITELARLKDVRVISRNSVLVYRDKPAPTPVIARQLDVAALLSGTVQRQDGRVRISVQLIDAREDRNIWTSSWERPFRSVLDLQREIAESVARQVRKEIAGKPSSAPAEFPDPVVEAYLRGRYHLGRQANDSLRKAIAAFGEAIAQAPDFAEAHAGLADAYSLLADNGLASLQETMAPARQAAATACRLAPESAEARESLARVKLVFDWDLEDAAAGALEALRLNPGYPLAYQTLSWVRSAQGRFEEAVEAARRVRGMDPLSVSAHGDLAFALNQAGRHEEALEVLRAGLDLDERRIATHVSIASTLARLNRPRESFETYRRAFDLMGLKADVVQRLEEAFSGEGMAGFYRCWLDAFPDTHPIARASVQVHLGLKEQALSSLEEAWKARNSGLLWVENDPDFAPLKDEERFRKLVRQVHQGAPPLEAAAGGAFR